MKKAIIINGPNLNLTGSREKDIYGVKSFDDFYKEKLLVFAKKNNINLEYFQSNHEGLIIDKIHECIDAKEYNIIINPGALTHYSYAIHDALVACMFPVIEVHISNIYNRENWRKNSVISPSVTGVISGLGLSGYMLALRFISEF
ncbi:MAG: type II 3-dehydroquinate dehydratase [Actinomycetota bacterium]|nr:type II 3-dehydroquinate dehydratase [Actinomycetota bacterium]